MVSCPNISAGALRGRMRYTFDKDYYDLAWFKRISDEKAFFATRIKDNAQIEVLGQHRDCGCR